MLATRLERSIQAVAHPRPELVSVEGPGRFDAEAFERLGRIGTQLAAVLPAHVIHVAGVDLRERNQEVPSLIAAATTTFAWYHPRCALGRIRGRRLLPLAPLELLGDLFDEVEEPQVGVEEVAEAAHETCDDR